MRSSNKFQIWQIGKCNKKRKYGQIDPFLLGQLLSKTIKMLDIDSVNLIIIYSISIIIIQMTQQISVSYENLASIILKELNKFRNYPQGILSILEDRL